MLKWMYSVRSINQASSAPCCMEAKRERHMLDKRKSSMRFTWGVLKGPWASPWQGYQLQCSQQDKSYTIIAMLSLRWLEHVRRMEKCRLPKDLLYGQLELGKRQQVRPHLKYKDSCIMDLKSANTAAERSSWRHVVYKGWEEADVRRC